MGIQRGPMPPDHFTQVRNVWLRDKRATLKAKGLLAYLMSHRIGYKISQAQIIRDSDDGRTAVVTACDELERLGYLQRTRAASSGGRFAEYDYVISDPFDAAGALLPTSAGNPDAAPGTSAENPTSAGNQHGATSAGNPQRRIAPLEEQREKTTPGLSDQATQLALVESSEPTRGQRALALARVYHERVDKMAPFMGVRNVVDLALKAGKWTDDEVAAALDVVAERRLTLTANVLRAVLDGATTPGRPTPYRDPAPAAYHQGF